VFHKPSLPFARDKFLGKVDTDVASLLEVCRDAEGEETYVFSSKFSLLCAVVKLELDDIKSRPAGTISVRFMGAGKDAPLALDHARMAAEKVTPQPTTATIMKTGGIVVHSASTANALASALYSVTSKLDIIVSIGDQIATVR
jgi:hypothetical protein